MFKKKKDFKIIEKLFSMNIEVGKILYNSILFKTIHMCTYISFYTWNKNLNTYWVCKMNMHLQTGASEYMTEMVVKK